MFNKILLFAFMARCAFSVEPINQNPLEQKNNKIEVVLPESKEPSLSKAAIKPPLEDKLGPLEVSLPVTPVYEDFEHLQGRAITLFLKSLSVKDMELLLRNSIMAKGLYTNYAMGHFVYYKDQELFEKLAFFDPMYKSILEVLKSEVDNKRKE